MLRSEKRDGPHKLDPLKNSTLLRPDIPESTHEGLKRSLSLGDSSSVLHFPSRRARQKCP